MKTKLKPTCPKARAAFYVPLKDMLCEIVYAIKDDPCASSEMRALARRGRKVLDQAAEAVETLPAGASRHSCVLGANAGGRSFGTDRADRALRLAINHR